MARRGAHQRRGRADLSILDAALAAVSSALWLLFLLLAVLAGR